ncbi:MAG: hypothetical protein QOG30_1512, partial [Acidimicrobiaceae bacterium]
MRRSTVLAVALVAALLLGACGNDTKADSTGSNDPNTVDVLTAPSLKNLVTKVLAAYKKDHPGTQFHVFTQDQPAITKSVDERKADIAVLPDVWLSKLTTQLTPRSFGRNLAVIAVATDNPHNITDLSVFAAGSGLRTHVSGVRSGFGDFMQPVLDKAGIVPDPASVSYGGEDQALQDV